MGPHCTDLTPVNPSCDGHGISHTNEVRQISLYEFYCTWVQSLEHYPIEMIHSRIYLSLLRDTAHSIIAWTVEHWLDLELTKDTHLSWPHRWVMGWLLWVLWGNLWYTYQECTVQYVYGLVQERRNSIANALELRLSCTKPSIHCLITVAYPQFALHPPLTHNPGCEALGLWTTPAPETTQNKGAKNR